MVATVPSMIGQFNMNNIRILLDMGYQVDVAADFARFYEARREKGLPPEKKQCIFTKGSYTPKDVERLILNMPFRRFEDMHAVHHAKQLGTIQFYKSLFNQLTEEDFTQIRESSMEALRRYFGDNR